MNTQTESTRTELEFRLSLLRLLTEPHTPAGPPEPTQETRQLETLVELTKTS